MNYFYSLNYYFNFLFYNILHKFLNKTFDKNMSNNFTALTHASGCTILGLRYLLNKTESNYYNLTSYSAPYFLYDMLFILKNWKASELNYAYMYHHFASLYLMHQNPLFYKGGHILFFGELSNLPSYFVYYYQKKNKNSSIVKKLKYLQFLLYAGIRVPVISKILIDAYNGSRETGNYLPLVIGSPVFLMGLIWTKKLYNKL